CLKVGGYLRVQIGVGGGDANGFFGLGGHQDVLDRSTDLLDNDTYSWLTRGNIHFDARTESELGTLRSYIELSFNNQSDVNEDNEAVTAPGWALEHAFIQLGGFTIGYSD